MKYSSEKKRLEGCLVTKINIPDWGEYQGIIRHLLSSYKIVMKKENTMVSKKSLLFYLGFLGNECSKGVQNLLR